MVCRSTSCSCRAGTSSEKERLCAPSLGTKRVPSSISGVRQACSIHQSVSADMQKSVADTSSIKMELTIHFPPEWQCVSAVC